jgi:hypothetical protein
MAFKKQMTCVETIYLSMCARLATVRHLEVEMAVCDDARRATDRLCAEYGQLPGLSLTDAQAARLLGLDLVRVVAVLEALEHGAFLVSASGQFVRWDHALRRGYSNPNLRHLATTTGVTDATTLYVALAAGFTADTANLLPLAPLVLVAWADGTMSDRERAVILDAASAGHVEPQSRADHRLHAWMADCPGPPFWRASLHVLGAVMRALPREVRADRMQHLLAGCEAVAAASRDGFGFGRATGEGERQTLARIAAISDQPPTS